VNVAVLGVAESRKLTRPQSAAHLGKTLRTTTRISAKPEVWHFLDTKDETNKASHQQAHTAS
jgi:hypothetical protein